MLPTPTTNATHYYHYHDNCPAKRFPAFVENFLKVHRRDSSVVSQFLSDAFPLWSQSSRCRPASQHSQLLRSSQVLRLGEEK